MHQEVDQNIGYTEAVLTKVLCQIVKLKLVICVYKS